MPTRTKSNPLLLIHAASVAAAIMSREVAFLFLSMSSLFALSEPSPENCFESDMAELEDYLSRLDFENVPTINMMIGGFKCPVTALPFGALKSDWARLLLLQNAQPSQSILPEKLGRLFRILTMAYFQMEERFDVVTSSGSAATAGVNRGTNEIVTTPSIVIDNGVSTIATLDTSTTVAPTLAGNQTADGTEETTVRSFNRTPTNRIKIKRPPINRKIPLDKDFWRYIIGPPKFTSVTAFAPVTEKGFTKGSSKKRGSPSTDVQKNFRWFYNVENGNSSSDLRDVDIRCAGRRSNDE